MASCRRVRGTAASRPRAVAIAGAGQASPPSTHARGRPGRGLRDQVLAIGPSRAETVIVAAAAHEIHLARPVVPPPISSAPSRRGPWPIVRPPPNAPSAECERIRACGGQSLRPRLRLRLLVRRLSRRAWTGGELLGIAPPGCNNAQAVERNQPPPPSPPPGRQQPEPASTPVPVARAAPGPCLSPVRPTADSALPRILRPSVRHARSEALLSIQGSTAHPTARTSHPHERTAAADVPSSSSSPRGSLANRDHTPRIAHTPSPPSLRPHRSCRE